jgi:N-acetylated-alpha-linked acidic dipeptidase
MSHNYSGVPQDEESAQQAENGTQRVSWTQRIKNALHNKFHGSDEERAPLIDSNRMTIEPPKHKTVKIILSVLFFVLFAVLLGGLLAFWFRGHGSSKLTARYPRKTSRSTDHISMQAYPLMKPKAS